MLAFLEDWWSCPEKALKHDRALELTLIRIMVGMMQQDGQLNLGEHEAATRLLRRRFGISANAAGHLLEEARQAEENDPAYAWLTQQVTHHYSWLDLAGLLDDIWCVAGAEGRPGSLDAQYVQRISTLLGIPAGSPDQQPVPQRVA